MKQSIFSLAGIFVVLASVPTAAFAQQPSGSTGLQPGKAPGTGFQLAQPGKTTATGNTASGRFQTASTAVAPSPAVTPTTQPQQNPAEIPWLRSATEAAIQSQSTGKPILVYVRSQNCHYCDLLQKDTWQDASTKAKVMREMIPLKLTLEENKEAIEAMKVKGFPSVIIFSARREYLGRIDGYVTPEQFQSQVAKAMLAHQPNTSAPTKR